MKKLCCLLTLVVAALAVAQTPLSAELAYQLVAEDQPEVTITVSGKGRPEMELPEFSGGKWLKNQISTGSSMRSSFVNGKGSTEYTYTYTVPLLLTTDRAVTIPPVIVSLGKERVQTSPVTIPARDERKKQARSAGTGAIDLSTLMATLSFAGGKRHFVGETIPFKIEIAVPLPGQVSDISLPDFPDAQKIVFLKRGNVVLSAKPPVRRGSNTIYTFEGAIQPTKSGEFSTEAPMQISLRVPDTRSSHDAFDDFFLLGRRSAIVRREVICRCADNALTILPLPPLPQGAYDLNLGGSWQIKSHFSPEKQIKSGEMMTLVITGKGDRPATNLRAPKLQHEKFRIYPPEVKKQGDQFKIEYALIPLTAGKQELDFQLAVFDPTSGKYQLFHAQTTADVGQGAGSVAENLSRREEIVPENVSEAPSVNAFYLRRTGRNFVILPLWKNVWGGVVALFCVAGMLAVAVFTWHKRQSFTPRWRRRLQRKNLHDLVKSADAPTLNAGLPGAIGTLLGLPPGVTTAEIAEQVQDEVVRRALNECGKSEFMPGVAVWNPSRQGRRELWRHLKKLGLLFAVLMPLLSMAETPLFDAGHFAEAAKQNEAKLDFHRMDTDLLYNIGSAHFHAGNFAAARLALRRAALLAPRDREIASRLVQVGDQLPAQELTRTAWARQIDRMIGVMRPDEWIFAAALAVAGMLLLTGFATLVSRALGWTLWSVAILWLAVALLALQQEKSRLYHPDNAMTIAEVDLRSLPGETTGRIETSLPAGSDLRILETHGKWSLVESAKGRGWVASEKIERLFPAGL